jgi:hypothetical protein
MAWARWLIAAPAQRALLRSERTPEFSFADRFDPEPVHVAVDRPRFNRLRPATRLDLRRELLVDRRHRISDTQIRGNKRQQRDIDAPAANAFYSQPQPSLSASSRYESVPLAAASSTQRFGRNPDR